jgi:hypothetical protein
MQTKEWLQSDIDHCKVQLEKAENDLYRFMLLPENNKYDDLESAKRCMYTVLEGRASEDCEGSYNCGEPEYKQQFMVGPKTYEATMELEYNRHDKQYYYIDSIVSFEVKEIK